MRQFAVSVSFEQLLDHYGISLKRSAKGLYGPCPIHRGEDANSFQVDPANQRFHCVSCSAHGNVIDFCAAMELCSIGDAVVKLQKWFPVAEAGNHRQENTISGPALALASVTNNGNRPLVYELQCIDYAHSYLKQRGITEETARHFGVGYCRRGFLAGQIAIPIHNSGGRLVAYAGRSIDGSEPQYKLPAGFRKSTELYNLHRAKQSGSGEVIVVEGFFDCLRVHQAGFSNVVALMGANITESQIDGLVDNFSHVSLMFDHDDTGCDGSASAVMRLVQYMFVTVVLIDEEKQPEDLSDQGIQRVLIGGQDRYRLSRVK